MADITTVYLPLAFHLTPSRGLTLIKQVVPVHWPTALELRGGGHFTTLFSQNAPLSLLPSPELACRYFARQLSAGPDRRK